METAFSLLYTAKDFPEIYASRSGPKPLAGERQELHEFLSLLYDILGVLDQQAQCPTGYDRLVSVLERGDVIITLNYDTLMDSALVRRGWEPAKGYSIYGGANKIKWKPNSAHLGELNGVLLLKLHGSLNWWVRGTAASFSNVFSKKPVMVTAPRLNGMAKMIRQVIPPIYGKFFGHNHWRKLWAGAFSALVDTDQLIVIGCSIVDTDYHLQALLRRAVKERNKHNKGLKVILVDGVRIRRRWQRVLRGAAAKYTTFNNLELFLRKGVKV